MKILNSVALIATLGSLNINAEMSSYDQAKITLKNAPESIKAVLSQAPKAYEFASQFDSTKSSVSYTGQTFRQVFISDIYSAMAQANVNSFNGSEQDAVMWLESYLNYDEQNRSTAQTVNADSFFQVKAIDFSGNSADIDEGFFYSDIQSPGKNLAEKLAGVDNPLRREKIYGVSANVNSKQLLMGWFNEYSKRVTASGQTFTVPNGPLSSQTVAKATVMPDGRDLSQLTQKFLHGSVAYSQAARDYFSTDLGPTKGLNADNTKPSKQGVFYTTLEHHFDEGFGYFGAARDYLSYTDAQIRNKFSNDTDRNGFISLKKEMNLGISTIPGRMDITAKDGGSDLSTEVMTAFIAGRHLITTKPEGYKAYAVAQATVALGAWEKSLGAMVIHYINRTIDSYDAYGTDQYLFTNFSKFWSEMKGYSFAFQFNPKGIMSDADFDKMHALMAETPVLPHGTPASVSAYKQNLLEARNILQKTYGFSEVNVQNW